MADKRFHYNVSPKTLPQISPPAIPASAATQRTRKAKYIPFRNDLLRSNSSRKSIPEIASSYALQSLSDLFSSFMLCPFLDS